MINKKTCVKGKNMGDPSHSPSQTMEEHVSEVTLGLGTISEHRAVQVDTMPPATPTPTEAANVNDVLSNDRKEQEATPNQSPPKSGNITPPQSENDIHHEKYGVTVNIEDMLKGVGGSFRCVQNACRGTIYDLKHFKSLPGENTVQKVHFATTRDGRMLYLIAMLIFVLGMVIAGYGVGKMISPSRERPLVIGSMQW